ncbi:MAG: YfhO family protein, partial [Clostridiaceae bacterium]|nr:YfhO family protein [Clostridiaceae bacterium]
MNRSTFAIKNRRRCAWNSKSLSLLAFLFPFLLLAIAYAVGQTFPFGNRHMLTVDLFHQYAPFLQLLRDKILMGGSPFYSLVSGLGVSFYALFAYYLASPLNLLLLLFPAPFLTEGIFLLTLIKVGLMGFAFFRFLLVSYRRKGILAVAFSTFYALSGFTLAYSWNIMWLDSLILLPVVVLALVRLIRDGKWILFPISVTMLLVCNYYTAFFASIFIALYFPILLFRYTEGSGIRKKILIVCKVVVLVAIGVALSAILLYPTFRSLSLTSAAGDHFPRKFELIGEPLTYLGQM